MIHVHCVLKLVKQSQIFSVVHCKFIEHLIGDVVLDELSSLQ